MEMCGVQGACAVGSKSASVLVLEGVLTAWLLVRKVRVVARKTEELARKVMVIVQEDEGDWPGR